MSLWIRLAHKPWSCPHENCVVLGKWLGLSEPQCPCLWNGENDSCWWSRNCLMPSKYLAQSCLVSKGLSRLSMSTSHRRRNPLWAKLAFFFIFYSYAGGTLWDLQKFLQYIKYIFYFWVHRICITIIHEFMILFYIWSTFGLLYLENGFTFNIIKSKVIK
jgi:hypothetical protein